MKKPEELREVTENVLCGLTADESLRSRILQNAAGAGREERRSAFRPVPALCGVIAALLIAVVALNGLNPVNPADPGDMNIFAAGSNDTRKSVLLDGIDPDEVTSIEITDLGTVSGAEQCAALISLLTEKAAPAGSSDPSAESRLNITLAGGTVIRFSVDEPVISGDGTWSCPEFFDLFRQELGR